MEITGGRLHAAYRRFWSQHEMRRLFPAFLVLMHQIVRASVPLMRRAQDVARERAADDEVCRRLTAYLADHIAEERAHDEWVLEDLESAGWSRETVLNSIPPAPVASLVGAQYYWIIHHDPVALMGYMRLLEGYPPSASHVARLQQQTGLPGSVFRTYRLHGELDPDHLGELDRLLDALPLTESQGHLIWISASHTSHALADCLEGLVQEASGHIR